MKNLSKKLLVTALAGVAFASTAAQTINPTVGFTTLPDITLNEIQAINFGNVLKLSQNATCTMALGTDASGTDDHVFDAATIRAAAADVPAPSNAVTPGTYTDDCATGATGTGTPGLYEIVAEAGTDVTVILTGIDSTELGYAAAGYGISAGGGELPITDGGAGQTFTTPTSATATSTAGVLRVAVGGTLTNLVKLDPDTSYSASLQIDVNY